MFLLKVLVYLMADRKTDFIVGRGLVYNSMTDRFGLFCHNDEVIGVLKTQ